MPEIIFNSFATNTEQTPHLLPQNAPTYSTVSSPPKSRGEVKMDFEIRRPNTGNSACGDQLRAVTGTVKDRMRRKLK